MLLAAFGTLMSSSRLEAIASVAGKGKFDTKLSFAGSYKVEGWRFDYVANKESWNMKSVPDISPDPNSFIWVVAYDFPTRALNTLCEANGVYSGQYKFDSVNIHRLNREAITIRLYESQSYSKPIVGQVLAIARAALEAGVDESYVYDVLIGKARFDHDDAELIYDEEMYSNRVGRAGEMMRDWYSQNVRYTSRSN